MLCNDTGVLPGSDYYFGPVSLTSDFHYNITQCGSLFCEYGYDIDRLYYDALLLAYIVEGEFFITYRGTDYTAHAGDAVLIDCRFPHRYRSGHSLTFLWIHPIGGQSIPICRELTQKSILFHHEGIPRLYKRLYRLISTFRNGQELSRHQLSSAVFELLCLLYPPQKDFLPRANQAISDVITYMKQNIDRPLKVDQLAQIAHMSSDHFAHVFRHETGIAPYEYLLRLRIDLAKHLLKTTNLRISQVASAVGYQSDMGFILAFSNRVGISPSVYRKFPI